MGNFTCKKYCKFTCIYATSTFSNTGCLGQSRINIYTSLFLKSSSLRYHKAERPPTIFEIFEHCLFYCTKKWSFPLRISSINVTLVIFTKKILAGKLHILGKVFSWVFILSGIKKRYKIAAIFYQVNEASKWPSPIIYKI